MVRPYGELEETLPSYSSVSLKGNVGCGGEEGYQQQDGPAWEWTGTLRKEKK